MIHIITGEYPSVFGGVADYTAQLANALANDGQSVHVWTAGTSGDADEDGVFVHRVAGTFHPKDLVRLAQKMDALPGPRRVLVQWTPPSFGMRSLNLAFPLWLWKRSATDRIEVTVHEAFIAFGEGKWKRELAAVVQRAMAVMLLRAASKVWVTIPKWEQRLRPWTLGKKLAFEWLPVPSNIPAIADVGAIVELRRQFTQFRHPLVGHFGTFRRDVEDLLFPALRELTRSSAVFLLVGRGSEGARRRLITDHPELTERVFATGETDGETVATHLSACDVLLQPFPDGISTRRGSAMAALSLGIPLVTNLGPLSEPLWESSGAIAIAPSSSAEDMSAVTLELIGSHVQRSQISAQARNLYQDRFHIQHTVSALLRGSGLDERPAKAAHAQASA